MLKKTSSQRAKEAFEMQKEKQRKKKEVIFKKKINWRIKLDFIFLL